MHAQQCQITSPDMINNNNKKDSNIELAPFSINELRNLNSNYIHFEKKRREIYW